VDLRFARERASLLPLPPQGCDVSLRLYREVRKDCTIPVDGNRYVVPHPHVGDQVLVRLGDETLRIFADAQLLVTHPLARGKGELIGTELYAALRADRALQARKYRQSRRGKGRATISPSAPPPDAEVEVRPLAAYQALGGEVAYA
jgi:hypothetical protein